VQEVEFVQVLQLLGHATQTKCELFTEFLKNPFPQLLTQSVPNKDCPVVHLEHIAKFKLSQFWQLILRQRVHVPFKLANPRSQVA
jgi:hypothetical protein